MQSGKTFKLQSYNKKITDFKPTGIGTPGVSPSFQAEQKGGDGSRFQIKRSNFIKTLRRIGGYDPNQADILGEYISSQLMARFLNHENLPELAPEVSLVYNQNTHDFNLASRYLNDLNTAKTQYVGMTFGDLVKKKENNQKIEGDTKLIFDQNLLLGHNQLPIGKPFGVMLEKDQPQVEVTLDKKELYQALKSSIILGEHDLNPDNFYIVHDKAEQKTHIGRIDMGHAFNDLIKRWGIHEQLPVKNENRGFVLDALNRETVNGGKTKFLRYFGDGVTLDPEFAEVLRANINEFDDVINDCKNSLSLLMNNDPETAKAINDSIITLCQRIGQPLVKGENPLDGLMARCTNFISSNQKEAESVANLIDVQAKIDQMIKTENEEEIESLAKEIRDIYNSDERYLKEKSFENKIEWVRTSQTAPPIKANLYQYIEYRSKELGIEVLNKKLESLTSAEKEIGIKKEPWEIVNEEERLILNDQVNRGQEESRHGRILQLQQNEEVINEFTSAVISQLDDNIQKKA